MKAYFNKIGQILAWDSTRPTRMFIGLLDIVFAMYLTTSVSRDDMHLMSNALSAGSVDTLWIILFILHGLLVLRGLTGKYSFFSLMGEGVLGVFIWGITAITHTLTQGLPGPTSICLAMCIWICARHPLDFHQTKDRRYG